MNISIIGTGYVGLVTGTCLADFGLSVTCVDQDETKISFLNKESKVIFITVGTPSNDDGSVNLVQIEEVAKQIALSTPSPLRGKGGVRVKYPFDVVSNPEFLREGSAVYDFTYQFLHPGPGFGGSCFPKDTRALNAIAQNYEYDFKLIKAVIEANQRQREIVVEKIEKVLVDIKGKTIAILGLAFKQNTDDVCESASLDIIRLLLQKGATIKCYDPMAMENSKKILPDITYCVDEYQTAQKSNALVILTEWNQFRNLNLIKIKKLMNKAVLIDLRNLYEPEKVKSLRFIYEGIGRN